MQPPLIFGKPCHQHFSQLVGWVHHFLWLHFKFQLSLNLRLFNISKPSVHTSVRHPRGVGTFRFSLPWGQLQKQHWHPGITLKISEQSHQWYQMTGGVPWCTARIWYEYASYIFQQIRVKLNICRTVTRLLNLIQKLKGKFLPSFSVESCLSSKTLHGHLKYIALIFYIPVK